MMIEDSFSFVFWRNERSKNKYARQNDRTTLSKQQQKFNTKAYFSSSFCRLYSLSSSQTHRSPRLPLFSTLTLSDESSSTDRPEDDVLPIHSSRPSSTGPSSWRSSLEKLSLNERFSEYLEINLQYRKFYMQKLKVAGFKLRSKPAVLNSFWSSNPLWKKNHFRTLCTIWTEFFRNYRYWYE